MGKLDMKPQVSLGIDPGSSSGNYAMLHYADGEWNIQVTSFKNVTLAEFFQDLKDLAEECDVECVSEVVHGFPGMSTVAVSSFMKNMGHIEMALAAAGIPTRYVSPQTWMKYFGLKKEKEESKTVWKKRLREVLQQRIPEADVTVEQTDAVLIALYGKLTRQ